MRLSLVTAWLTVLHDPNSHTPILHPSSWLSQRIAPTLENLLQALFLSGFTEYVLLNYVLLPKRKHTVLCTLNGPCMSWAHQDWSESHRLQLCIAQLSIIVAISHFHLTKLDSSTSECSTHMTSGFSIGPHIFLSLWKTSFGWCGYTKFEDRELIQMNNQRTENFIHFCVPLSLQFMSSRWFCKLAYAE